jgi:RNA polymerase sigma factor (sigma-70 family)
MDRDTDMGGRASGFPTTRHSVVAATRSPDPEERSRALEALAQAYWKPVYKYLRWRWNESNEDAKDSTQAFFTRAIEKAFFEDYDPRRAKFRTYLRVCLDRFLANERKSAQRQKRSPRSEILSLDFDGAERELDLQRPAEGIGPEDYFHREWVRSLFGTAVERLRDDCRGRGKELSWRLFELYDLGEDPSAETASYEDLAARFEVSVSAVTNALAFARREFRSIVLELLRESTGSEEEFRAEARAVLGQVPETP